MKLEISQAHEPLVRNRISSLGVDGATLLRVLRESNALIAGSFPLQCLLGETYSDSDIDIFVKDDGNDTFHQTSLFRFLQLYGGVESSEYLLRGIIRSSKTIVGKAVINIIRVNKNPFDFIMETFDFSPCITIFDGKKLMYYSDTLHKIATKYPSKENYKNREQYHQSNDPNMTNFYPSNVKEYMEKRAQQRVKKYEERGFFFVSPEMRSLLEGLRSLNTKETEFIRTLFEAQKLF